MVHQKNIKKYYEEYVHYLIRKENMKTVLDYAVWDRVRAECINTLSLDELLDILRKKFEKRDMFLRDEEAKKL